ncbi:MAG: lipid II flippase MurJ, partial [Yoonia sp.]
GTSITGWAMVVLLVRGARTMGDAARFDARFKQRMVRIVLAALGMGVILMVASAIMTPLFGIATVRYLALLVLVLIGIISYFGIGHLIGAFKLSEFRRNLRR